MCERAKKGTLAKQKCRKCYIVLVCRVLVSDSGLKVELVNNTRKRKEEDERKEEKTREDCHFRRGKDFKLNVD